MSHPIIVCQNSDPIDFYRKHHNWLCVDGTHHGTGFHVNDFQLAEWEVLLEKFPAQQDIIMTLTTR